MRKLVVYLLTFAFMSGCTAPAWTPPTQPELVPFGQGEAAVTYPNPVVIPLTDAQCAWELVADVVSEYFKISHEEPLRQVGGPSEGRIDTFPQVSPTIFEPWRQDTVGEQDRVENSIQTMRRYAVVRMRPAEKGFSVEVAVFKELEDLPTPEHASAGAATFRYDTSFTRVVNPSSATGGSKNWIPKGRDPLLEQRIIGHLLSQCNEMGSNGVQRQF